MFLSQSDLHPTGGFDHSVFDTFVQLTEKRSARDQPKQPPAKKKRMARPKRGRTRPTISLELDCDLESEAGRRLENYKPFKRVP